MSYSEIYNLQESKHSSSPRQNPALVTVKSEIYPLTIHFNLSMQNFSEPQYLNNGNDRRTTKDFSPISGVTVVFVLR